MLNQKQNLQKETTQVLLFVFIVRHCLKHVLHKIVVSPETRYQSVPCVFARRNTLTITKLSACFLLCHGYGFAKSHQYLSDETGPRFDHKGHDLDSRVSSPPAAAAARLGPSYFFMSLVLGPLNCCINNLFRYIPSSRYIWR